jgi:hypothetical protein
MNELAGFDEPMFEALTVHLEEKMPKKQMKYHQLPPTFGAWTENRSA